MDDINRALVTNGANVHFHTRTSLLVALLVFQLISVMSVFWFFCWTRRIDRLLGRLTHSFGSGNDRGEFDNSMGTDSSGCSDEENGSTNDTVRDKRSPLKKNGMKKSKSQHKKYTDADGDSDSDTQMLTKVTVKK